MSSSGKLLIVDDESVAIDIFRGIFEDDFEIEVASSGEEAVIKASQFLPDVMVLDAVMPEMTGWDVCRHVKTNPRTQSIKVIMLSAKAVSIYDRRAGYMAGADDYIVKPYIHEDLYAKVHVWSRIKLGENEIEKKMAELEAARMKLEMSNEVLEEKIHHRSVELIQTNRELEAEIRQRRFEEKEKEELRAQLLQSQKLEAIGQLAGGIAHDFNNLLGAIIGNADLLKGKVPEDPEVGKYLDRIITSSMRGSTLVSQLLTFARKGPLVKKVININSLISDVVSLLENTLDKRIEINTELNANMANIVGDKTLLQNAFLNLAINSRDAMPKGGSLTFITENINVNDEPNSGNKVSIPAGQYLLIVVSDTGVGMTPAIIHHIFEPFFTTKGENKGTGLGLASVYGCVKQHDGHIFVNSEQGRGATFKIYLPVTKDPVVYDNVSDGINLSLQTGHVLLIDDEAPMLEVGSEMLKMLGFTVKCCKSGIDAVDYYLTNHDSIDLVILDMIMPNMAGRDCFFNLKKIDPTIPILISSGHSINKDIKEVLDSGAAAFLVKPFDSNKLAKVVAVIAKKK